MAGMGHAVMGTAVRSGENRAIEAAQAAMASPLLEAGAIDGARGILINITGSSGLKLSEVNAASSLIQTSAHEDANIIFGAVLDEKMGDEVKITVIATGFRDQMPERRARMLTVEESPVVSVPVMAPDNWLREPAPPVATSAPEAPAAPVVSVEPVPAVQPPAPPAPPRFLSEDEEPETAQQDDPTFYAAEPAKDPIAEEAQEAASFEESFNERELVASPARPKFAEMDEEAAYTPLPRDYASDLGNGLRAPEPFEDHRQQPVAALFAENGTDAERDLDVPAFMRRLQF